MAREHQHCETCACPEPVLDPSIHVGNVFIDGGCNFCNRPHEPTIESLVYVVRGPAGLAVRFCPLCMMAIRKTMPSNLLRGR